MLEKESQVKELYELKHINDNELHVGFDYETNLVNNAMSNVMFKNDRTNTFLTKTKKLLLNMVESNLVVRNFFNYTVHKYYSRHNN